MKAFLIVDMQNDFMPGGPLAVPGGDKIIFLINSLTSRFSLVIASQDWHPEDHMSFACVHPGKKVAEVVKIQGEDQILWPVHCVQNSEGAKIVSGIDPSKIDKVILKGSDRWIDGYSAFFDHQRRKSTGLADYLTEKKVDTLYLAGVATDYCIFYSALDALDLGFNVFVIQDACRGLDLKKGDGKRALQLLKEKGAHLITSDEIPN